MTSSTLRSPAPLLVTVLALLLSAPAAAQADSQAEDDRSDASAEQRAKTYNSSRSNKAGGEALGPAGDDACADCEEVAPAGRRTMEREQR